MNTYTDSSGKSSVDFYVTGTLTAKVHFPNGEVKCKWCPFLKRDRAERDYCELTHGLIYNRNELDKQCQLEFEETKF